MGTPRHAKGAAWPPKGTPRALGRTTSRAPGRTKGQTEMQGLGRRHRKAVWWPLACPKRPTLGPRAHGKANRDALRRQEEKSSGLGKMKS